MDRTPITRAPTIRSRLPLVGRALGLLLVLAGAGVALLAASIPSYGVIGSVPFALGPLRAADLLGLGGSLVAAGAAPVLLGRWRFLSVSVGAVLVFGTLVLLVVAPAATTPLLWVGLLGLLLVSAATLATGG